MGVGAFVSIHNLSSRPLTVEYARFNCMYQNGNEGSDFGPISGSLPPNSILPVDKSRQYIESKNSSSGGDICATDPSIFTMRFNAPNGSNVCEIGFQEAWGRWFYNDIQNHDTNVFYFDVGVTKEGNQYDIRIFVRPKGSIRL